MARTIRRKHAGHLRLWTLQNHVKSGSGYIDLPRAINAWRDSTVTTRDQTLATTDFVASAINARAINKTRPCRPISVLVIWKIHR